MLGNFCTDDGYTLPLDIYPCMHEAYEVYMHILSVNSVDSVEMIIHIQGHMVAGRLHGHL